MGVHSINPGLKPEAMNGLVPSALGWLFDICNVESWIFNPLKIYGPDVSFSLCPWRLKKHLILPKHSPR
jgi:hypothetical protein